MNDKCKCNCKELEIAHEALRKIMGELMNDECTCGGVDVGVGDMHEPTCGLPNIEELKQACRIGLGVRR